MYIPHIVVLMIEICAEVSLRFDYACFLLFFCACVLICIGF